MNTTAVEQRAATRRAQPAPRALPNEFLFSIFALLASIIVIHGIFVLHVRPQATAIMMEQRAQMLANPEYVAERSLYIIIKDWEQEAEIILMFWALAILWYRMREQREER